MALPKESATCGVGESLVPTTSVLLVIFGKALMSQPVGAQKTSSFCQTDWHNTVSFLQTLSLMSLRGAQ